MKSTHIDNALKQAIKYADRDQRRLLISCREEINRMEQLCGNLMADQEKAQNKIHELETSLSFFKKRHQESCETIARLAKKLGE